MTLNGMTIKVNKEVDTWEEQRVLFRDELTNRLGFQIDVDDASHIYRGEEGWRNGSDSIGELEFIDPTTAWVLEHYDSAVHFVKMRAGGHYCEECFSEENYVDQEEPRVMSRQVLLRCDRCGHTNRFQREDS